MSDVGYDMVEAGHRHEKLEPKPQRSDVAIEVTRGTICSPKFRTAAYRIVPTAGRVGLVLQGRAAR